VGCLDRLKGGQGVIAPFAAAAHAPQLVIGQAVATMEVADAMRAVVGRREADGFVFLRPGAAVAGAYR